MPLQNAATYLHIPYTCSPRYLPVSQSIPHWQVAGLDYGVSVDIGILIMQRGLLGSSPLSVS